MHQVYDDEMTFKLVAAASKVSGLPVEVCLEEFGKHFLLYCQKNGYDQILRVLGSNLHDFLTNLDNLHDHLASIYPGMRAPSFRVTRNLHTNQLQSNIPGHGKVNLAESEVTGVTSMYLHYYSERAGLSPIVKGLVMAVAREFFHTEITVTVCSRPPEELEGSNVDLADDPDQPTKKPPEDHVVLKIDEPDQSQAQVAALADQELSRSSSNDQSDRRNQNSNQEQSILDSLSNRPSDSLVSGDIMMQTFPFHVIFDRQFKIVQVGRSLLRASSQFWRHHHQQQHHQNSDQPPTRPVKLNHLFSIVRPKIEFTFDAIADHTNQVFVVKTRPEVLNADLERSLAAGRPPWKRHSSSGSSTGSSSGVGLAHFRLQQQQLGKSPRCPFDRLAEEHRRKSGEQPLQEAVEVTGDNIIMADQFVTGPEQSPLPAEQNLPPSSSADGHLSLRLKGQMILLAGGKLCLFLCSPRVDHLQQLLDCQVTMGDLSLHDRARELMLMSHTHKEDRETVKKLDQASNDLKKMDTKLRAENKRTQEVLHNIFPAKIAKILSHGQQVDSESFEMVTCLYSDIIGFTKMCGSENVKPIDIVRLLNTLYLQFDNLTNIHQVFKVETIGDAYVVVAGLPEPADDHADRCVRMGLDMVKVIATVRSPADKQPIQMRIGIHSGPVMSGIVGIRVPRYSLFGNTTTLANQLESHGVGGKIHISQATLDNLIARDRFVVEDNPSQASSTFPFVTYFVTDYLADQLEAEKHERILEEQLIKDFELLRNELELVDDSSIEPAPPQPSPLNLSPQPATTPTKLDNSMASQLASGSRQVERMLVMDVEGLQTSPSIAEDDKSAGGGGGEIAPIVSGQLTKTGVVLDDKVCVGKTVLLRRQLDIVATQLSRSIIANAVERYHRVRGGTETAPEVTDCLYQPTRSASSPKSYREQLEMELDSLVGSLLQAEEIESANNNNDVTVENPPDQSKNISQHCSLANHKLDNRQIDTNRLPEDPSYLGLHLDEFILAEIRRDRRQVSRQLDRLERLLLAGSAGSADLHEPNRTGGGQHQVSIGPLCVGVQRMKRADTLKLRRIKRQQERQQQQQQQQQPAPNQPLQVVSSLSATPSPSSLRFGADQENSIAEEEEEENEDREGEEEDDDQHLEMDLELDIEQEVRQQTHRQDQRKSHNHSELDRFVEGDQKDKACQQQQQTVSDQVKHSQKCAKPHVSLKDLDAADQVNRTSNLVQVAFKPCQNPASNQHGLRASLTSLVEELNQKGRRLSERLVSPLRSQRNSSSASSSNRSTVSNCSCIRGSKSRDSCLAADAATISPSDGLNITPVQKQPSTRTSLKPTTMHKK